MKEGKRKLYGLFLVLFSVYFSCAFPLLLYKTGVCKKVILSAPTRVTDKREFIINGKSVYMSVDECIEGVLANDASFIKNDEALKALAVAYRTRLLYETEKIGGEAIMLDGMYNYITLKEANEAYGVVRATELFERAGRAVRETNGALLFYQSGYALSLVHRSSRGETVSGERYGYKNMPYLSAVKTIEEPDCVSISVDYKNLAYIVGGVFDIPLVGDASEWIKGVYLYKDGRVQSVVVCYGEIDGEEFRKKIGLSSSEFEYICGEKDVAFTSYGEGNGVGMSKMGADALAERGEKYDEILEYYFSGCKVSITE